MLREDCLQLLIVARAESEQKSGGAEAPAVQESPDTTDERYPDFRCWEPETTIFTGDRELNDCDVSIGFSKGRVVPTHPLSGRKRIG